MYFSIKEMHRVLKPGGRLVLCHLTAYGEADKKEAFRIQKLRNPARKNFFLPEDFLKMLKKYKFSDLKSSEYITRESVNQWINHGAIGDEARERIRAGEDFADVAREVSLSPDARDGGDLGFFSRGVMPAEFDEAVFPLKEGTLSEVVRSPYGFHIFLVEEKTKAKDLSLDEVRGEITEILRRRQMEKLYIKFIVDIKKKAEIEIDQQLLKRSVGIK